MKKMLIAMLLVLAMMVAASAFADEAKKPTSSFNGVNLIPGGVSPVAINIFTGRPIPSEGAPAFVSTDSELKGNGVNLLPGGVVSPVAVNIFTGRPFSMGSGGSEPKDKGNGVNLIPGGVSPVAINIFTGRPF